MRTLMIVKKNQVTNQIEQIGGPCIECETAAFVDIEGVEMIDEYLFKLTHPELHKEAVLNNVLDTVIVWLHMLYGNEKPMCVEENNIVTSEFMITVELNALRIAFSVNTAPSEAANLILHLKSYLIPEISMYIAPNLLFWGNFPEN